MARRLSGRIAALAALVVVCLAVVWAFGEAGRWLVRQDRLGPANVIVVLSGGMPWRAEEAARIFSLGDAPEVWVTRPSGPVAELDSMGIAYLGEDYFSRQVLIHSGVPEGAVRVLPEPSMDTEQEVAEIAREMRRNGKTRAIIVTSPEHTRRVKALWRAIIGPDPEAVVRAAPNDPFDADHWWRDTTDTFAVVREWMGLVNVWLGLPVRPRSR